MARTRDGRALHHMERGEGRPTVVFESGLGSSRGVWGLVQPAVAARTRAIVYDRSGLGRSPSDPAARTLERMAGDLADLLEAVGGGPFVLVAHSYGGPIVRSVAVSHPELVAALVLVDQTDETCDVYFSGPAMRQQRILAAVVPFAARTGLLRLVLRRVGRTLPPDVAADLRREDGTVAAAKASQAELAPVIPDLRALRAAAPRLPDIPVTLISGTRKPRSGAATRAALVASHIARAEALPDGRHVRAEHSGHYVMLTEPDLVVAEVLRTLDHL